MKKIIGIACKDAGAANLIFSWMKYNSKNYYRVILEKPASNIIDLFSLNKNKIKIVKKKNSFLKGLDYLVTGSGSFLFEKEIRNLALKKKIYVVTVLDHYLNFKIRFIKKKRFILPDEIWCFDRKTFFLSKKSIKNKIFRLKKNYYLKHCLEKIRPLRLLKDPYILYLTEPHTKTKIFKRSCELQSLKFFLDNFYRLNIKRYSKIIIRLHPKEKRSKYISIVKKYNKILDINFDNNIDLLKTINSSSIVFGLSSYALVVALKLKRKVFHCKLPGQKFKLLPYKGIKSFYKELK
jgi:hypothetical protein